MTLQDFHIHTTYCDGKSTPLEIVKYAIERGVEAIGFSGHSYTEFDPECCMSIKETEDYKKEINSLKKEYKNKINIFCGIEQDYFSKEPTDDYDFVIGSVHYIFKNNEYLAVDETEEKFVDFCKNYYNGNYYDFAKDYFLLEKDIINKTHPNIIGHFDLITKYNEGYKYFNEENEDYVKYYTDALNSLMNKNVTFEINYGAVTRGYRKNPYPNKNILKILEENNEKIIKNSDSHYYNTVCCWEK